MRNQISSELTGKSLNMRGHETNILRELRIVTIKNLTTSSRPRQNDKGDLIRWHASCVYIYNSHPFLIVRGDG